MIELPQNCKSLAGYAALINLYELDVPTPDIMCVINKKHLKYEKDSWRFFTPRHEPENNLHGHLVFALRYEGLDLLILKTLFKCIKNTEIEAIIKAKPNSSYMRHVYGFYMNISWMLN